MPIAYSAERPVTATQFIELLRRTSLGARRPLHDHDRIASMLTHADLVCTAWEGERLIGIARSVTDFAYCCYLSDLAVDEEYQQRGIGKQLLRLTQSRLHPEATLILLAAPAATTYYPHIGMTPHPTAWTAKAGQPL